MAAPRDLTLNPTYYLDNFQLVLDWVEARYPDLLDGSEQQFIATFRALPQRSRALLVRMVMRKGELFRASRLRYAEIGDPAAACAPLCALGWVEQAPPLDLGALFALFTKAELAPRFPALARGRGKAEQLADLLAADDGAPAQPAQAWLAQLDEPVYRIAVLALCERLRLMFFGNCHQDWTEFILADLGVWRYESVPFDAAARAFESRQQIDDYLQLQALRERLDSGVPLAELAQALPPAPFDNGWLEARRRALQFQLAQQFERSGAHQAALALYRDCAQRGARTRAIRMLELLEQHDAALALAQQAQGAPECDAESQQLARMLPRLQRKAGLPRVAGAAPTPAAPHPVLTLTLAQPDCAVEEAVRRHLHEDDAPVFYVENALVNSLFGLLCWDAIFAALPGAFFHPFHSGPADLLGQDFHARRAALFDACLAQLDDGRYLATIRANFAAKVGTVSPFVYWDLLDAPLLELALACIPAAHLGHWCRRMLADLKANRSGFPDLIQFWPAERRYRMIEVKGPGDRLQDNQSRWLEFCAQHAMPVAVCHVRWAAP